MNSTSKRFAVLAAGTAAVMGTGVAFAAWTASGSGSGVAKATTAQLLSTVATTATVTGVLYPGISGASMNIQFDNPNPYPVTITSVSQDTSTGKFVSSDVVSNGCTDASGSTHPTGVSFAPATGLSLLVPAKSSSGDGTLDTTVAGVAMSNSSDNNCQGATFTIPVTFSGHSG